MRKVFVAFIAIFSILAVILIGLLIYTINCGLPVLNADTTKEQLVNTQNASLDNIESLDIKFYSDDITFYTSDTEELILKEYKNYTPEKDELAKISVNNSRLSIKGAETNITHVFGAVNHYSRAEIYLPKDYTRELSVSTTSGNIDSELVFKLKQLELYCSSGDIRINEVYADEIAISTTSGNITVQIAEGNRQISSTSGDIDVYGGTGDSSLDTTSGNVTLKKSSGKLSVNTSSGDIRLNALDGGGEISTTSGNVQFKLEKITNDITLNASSGEITLRLPDTASFNFAADSSSGDIRTFFDENLSFSNNRRQATGTIGGTPNITIQTKTTSGNIDIQK